MAFKAKNLKELPIKHVPVSASDVVEYLQNEVFGFSFDCDFKVWDNRMDYEKPINTQKCYVVMRCAFRPQDIIMQAQPGNYVDRALKNMAASTQFKDSFKKSIEPFMFPEKIRSENRPEVLQQLAEQGIYGERLELLRRAPRMFYDQVNNYWGVFLRPERIIAEMVKDPDEDKVDGFMSFGWLNADESNPAAITWGVNIYKGFAGRNAGVTIDAIFNSIRG